MNCSFERVLSVSPFAFKKSEMNNNHPYEKGEKCLIALNISMGNIILYGMRVDCVHCMCAHVLLYGWDMVDWMSFECYTQHENWADCRISNTHTHTQHNICDSVFIEHKARTKISVSFEINTHFCSVAVAVVECCAEATNGTRIAYPTLNMPL